MSSQENWTSGQGVEWLTRPIRDGYLRGIVVKSGLQKVGIAVQDTRTGKWKPKWAEPRYLRKVETPTDVAGDRVVSDEG